MSNNKSLKASEIFQNPGLVGSAKLKDEEKAELQAKISETTELANTTLSRKAYDFVYKSNFSGELSNKISMLGRESFETIFPYIITEEISKDLEISMYNYNSEAEIPEEIEGILVFASAVGINKEYILLLYKDYLKSFLR